MTGKKKLLDPSRDPAKVSCMSFHVHTETLTEVRPVHETQSVTLDYGDTHYGFVTLRFERQRDTIHVKCLTESGEEELTLTPAEAKAFVEGISALLR